MTNLYEELAVNSSSTVDDIQTKLRNLLSETRSMFSSACNDEEREKIEDRMILVKEAMRVFASEESKATYDEELQAERQQQHEAKVLKYGNIHLTDSKLKDLLREATEEEDWEQVLSITSIIKERGCEDADYYSALVQFYTNRHEYRTALSMLEEGMKCFGINNADDLLASGVILGMACLSNDQNDLNVAQRCVAIALENKTQLNGFAEVLEIDCDLAQNHYPLLAQKVNRFVIAYPNATDAQNVLCQHILVYINDHIVSHANNGVAYFASAEMYQVYRELMDSAIKVAAGKKTDLRRELDSWEKKTLVEGAWWGLAGYIIYSLILLMAPGGFPYFGALLLIFGIATYVMLYVPEWRANYYKATGALHGINDVFRKVNTVMGIWIKIIVKIYKWIFKMIFG